MALFIVDRVGTGFSVRPGENTLQAAASALSSQSWAEGPGEPGGAGTKSAKGWAEEAATLTANAQPAALNQRISLSPQRSYFVSGEVTGPLRGDTGASIASPTATVTSSELVISGTFGSPATTVRYWDVGARWTGVEPLHVTQKASLSTATNTNGVMIALGQGSSFVFFLYARTGIIGMFNAVGASIGTPTTDAEMVYNTGQTATLDLYLEKDGSGRLVATSPGGKTLTYALSGLSVPVAGTPFIVGPAWRRTDSGSISYFYARRRSLDGADLGIPAIEADVSEIQSQVVTLTADIASLPVSEPFAGIEPPVGYTFTGYGFRIRRGVRSGGYSTTFDPTSKRITTSANYYVNPITGSDSNSGTTEASPFATFYKALFSANAGGVPATIYLAPGEYSYTQTGTGGLLQMSVDINVICADSEPAILTLASTETGWAVNGTYANVYEKTVTGTAPLWGYDLGNLDAYGEGTPFNVQASVADVAANANSCFVSGSTIYVRLADDRAPDTNVRVIRNQNGWLFGPKRFYFENFQLLGGNQRTFYAVDGVGDSCTNNCRFSYAYNGNVFRIDRERGSGKHYNYRSVASWSSGFDGFNYHKSTSGTTALDVVEIECIGHHNGRLSGTTNNGSTIHEGGRIIRVSGDYSYNGQRNIHDVNDGTESWNLGCVAGSPKTQVGADDSVNFDIGIAGTSSTAKMWLDGCVSRGGAVTDFAVNIGATMYVRDTDTTTFKSNVTTGTLTGY